MTKDSKMSRIFRWFIVFIAITSSSSKFFVSCNDNLRVAFEWKQMNFEFRNDEDRRDAIENGTFIPSNVIPMGIEVYKDRLFITLPRWKPGVPATLTYIDLNGKFILFLLDYIFYLFLIPS